jgi:hypothetical protein
MCIDKRGGKMHGLVKVDGWIAVQRVKWVGARVGRCISII